MKPGKVPGPVKVSPNKKGDLTDYRRAKQLQDHLNWVTGMLSKKLKGPFGGR